MHTCTCTYDNNNNNVNLWSHQYNSHHTSPPGTCSHHTSPRAHWLTPTCPPARTAPVHMPTSSHRASPHAHYHSRLYTHTRIIVIIGPAYDSRSAGPIGLPPLDLYTAQAFLSVHTTQFTPCSYHTLGTNRFISNSSYK